MKKHTEGPWIVYGGNIVRTADNVRSICHVPNREPLSEVEANAALIAQAPDMRGLLIDALDLYREDFENDGEISGADFLMEFAEWRKRAAELIE